MTPVQLSCADAATDVRVELADYSRTTLRRTLRTVRRFLTTAACDWKRDPEHVHRLRVAARKAQTALWLFSDLTPAGQADWFRRQLKSILRAAGQARDLDVLLHDQLLRCGPAKRKLSRRWRADRRVLQKPLAALADKMNDRKRFRAHLRKLIRGLPEPTCAQLPSAGGKAEDQSATGPANWAKRRLADTGELFFDAVPVHADFESLHLLRRRAKRFRYSIELLRPLLQDSAIEQLKSKLAELQDQLGALQDHVVAHCQFQLSLAEVTRRRHQQQLETLIQFEHQQMETCAAQILAWTQSADFELLRTSFLSATAEVCIPDASYGS